MLKLLIGVLLFGSCAAYAEIRVATSLEPIQEEILSSPKETLVLLDVGGTLLAYPDVRFSIQCMAGMEIRVVFRLIALTSLEKKRLLFAIELF